MTTSPASTAPAPATSPAPAGGFLAQFGIHGWQTIETPILAGLLLGEPFCFISEPGMAKTYAARKLAEALGMTFGYYSADKVGWEDLAGFPNPAALKEGRIETIRTPLTVWDKNVVLLDEVSRIQRGMENRWLEILGSRMCLGEPLPIRAVIGAMNPLSNAGTQPLGEAFADRFVAFVPVPGMGGFDEELRRRIIGSDLAEEGASVGFWLGECEQAQAARSAATVEQVGAQLRAMLQQAALRYRRLSEGSPLNAALVDYCDLFAECLHRGAGIRLEARRMKMIKRFLAALVAVRGAELGRDLDEHELKALVRSYVGMTLTQQATGQGEITAGQIAAAHEEASSALQADRSAYLLFTAMDWPQRFAALAAGDFDPAVVQKVCADFAADRSTAADLAALALAPIIQSHEDALGLPADCLLHLVERIGQVPLAAAQSFDVEMTAAHAGERLAEWAQLQDLLAAAERSVAERLLLGLAFGHVERGDDGDSRSFFRWVLDFCAANRAGWQQALATLQPLAARVGADRAARPLLAAAVPA